MGTEKDHKTATGFNEDVFTQLQPNVGADESPNSKTSSIITEILQALELELDKKENVLCLRTEEFYMRSTNSTLTTQGMRMN